MREILNQEICPEDTEVSACKTLLSQSVFLSNDIYFSIMFSVNHLLNSGGYSLFPNPLLIRTLRENTFYTLVHKRFKTRTESIQRERKAAETIHHPEE